ncbi:MAG: DNA repair protein RecO [Chitinophagaceae bacterium]|nr:DNA repair protein RecO [Chitinophagaceae bacterium]
MPATVHHTKGIVLRAVKYGETSLIVSAYTEIFGIQSYILNGVRAATKRSGAKASYFQPSAILDMIVYHNDLKTIQRVKEFKWAYLYQHILFDVIKNSVALFMIELLQKTLKQPEPNPELFYFLEDAFIHLDSADAAIVANYPLFFASHLTSFFGFRLTDNYDDEHNVLDLYEGSFVRERPLHPNILEEPLSAIISQFLKVQHPRELVEIKISQDKRRALIAAYHSFYNYHVTDFGTMKTISIIQEVLG